MKNVWLSILALLLFLGHGTALEAQEPRPELRVTAGFAGLCQDDAWCPIRVVAVNEGANVSGELRFLVKARRVSDVSRYYRRITLPTNARKAYTFYLPPEVLISDDFPRVELVADDQILASTPVPLREIFADDYLHVTVGDSTGVLSFLGALQPIGRGQAHVVDVDLADLPDDPLAWESVDVLILQDIDTTALSNEQRRALHTWLQHGGHLAIGGGPGTATTLAGLSDLVPVNAVDNTSVQRLDGLQRYINAPVVDGPFPVAVTTLKDTGIPVIYQPLDNASLILAARREIGQGTVTFLAFDAGLNPFQGQSARVDFWRRLLGDDLGLPARPRFETGYALDQALSVIPGVSAPPVLQILGFLILYTLLVGPINYWVLHKLDRRTWAWIIVPTLAVLFSGLAYLSGSRLRGADPILHRLRVTYVPAGADQGRATEAVGLFSPRRRRYTLESENRHVTTLQLSGLQAAREALTVRQTSSGATIENAQFDVGELSAFAVDGYVPAPTLSANLDFAVDALGDVEVNGTVRTGTEALEDLTLLVGSHVESLGDLPPQTEKPLNLRLFHATLTPGSGERPFPDKVFQNTWSDPVVQRRYNLLASAHANSTYWDWNGPDFGTGVYLMAWQTDGLSRTITLTDGELTEHTTALYIYALPVNVSTWAPGGEILIPPSLFNWDYEILTGHVEPTIKGFYLDEESAVRVTFTPIPEVHLPDPETLTIQMIPDSSTAQPLPEVALWNHDIATWESLDVGWGETIIDEPTPYVSESGDVLCRLGVDARETPLMAPIPELTLRGQ